MLLNLLNLVAVLNIQDFASQDFQSKAYVAEDMHLAESQKVNFDPSDSDTVQEAVKWLRGEIKEGSNVGMIDQQDRPCGDCSLVASEETGQRLLIFVSFSLPMESWKALSRGREGMKPTFILRGIPGKRFDLFAQAIKELRLKGVTADIELNPQLFRQYQVSQIPAFLLEESGDLLYGNVSLEYALIRLRRGRDG